MFKGVFLIIIFKTNQVYLLLFMLVDEEHLECQQGSSDGCSGRWNLGVDGVCLGSLSCWKDYKRHQRKRENLQPTMNLPILMHLPPCCSTGGLIHFLGPVVSSLSSQTNGVSDDTVIFRKARCILVMELEFAHQIVCLFFSLIGMKELFSEMITGQIMKNKLCWGMTTTMQVTL